MEGQATDLKLFLGGQTPLLDVALQTSDGVLRASHPLYFLAGTVRSSGVGHPAQ
jgi:hypothetical protein